MANRKSPITLMLEANGEGWEYLAVLGTDTQHSRSAYKLYLHRRKGNGSCGEWWRFEGSIPFVSGRAETPYRAYPEPFNHIRGPVTSFPAWLECMESREGLLAAVQACRSLSIHCQESA